MSLPVFIYKDIEDNYVRENFKRIEDFLRQISLFKGDFEFFDLTFTTAESNKRIPHGLKFMPLDVIVTSSIGAGAATFNYSLFDTTYIDITTTGACEVRCFIGAYRE